MFCNTPPVSIPNEGNTQINTEMFTTMDDPLAELVASPATVTSNYGSIGTNPILTYTATDRSNNIASCQSQMKITGNKSHFVEIILSIVILFLHILTVV